MCMYARSTKKMGSLGQACIHTHTAFRMGKAAYAAEEIAHMPSPLSWAVEEATMASALGQL